LGGALLGGNVGSQLGNNSNWATILGALGGGILGGRYG
jgi:outer membrane lipoprotein SlyB